MRLAISRHAAPEIQLTQLATFARERGLAGIEISESDLNEAASLGQALGSVVGIRVESLAAAESHHTMDLAAQLHTPVIAAHGVIPTTSIAGLNSIYKSRGIELLITLGTSTLEAATLAEAIADAEADAIFLAWEVNTKRDNLSETAGILLATAGALRYIRMHGGGPELSDEEGAGTGALVSSVALSGFSGAITLTPSSKDRLADWHMWLEGKIKNGCGSAYEKKSKAMNIDLDIRPVEPRHRMETILGTYRALGLGRTMHVTFDHDPSCMYYTLQSMEPEGSFKFEKKDDGPDVWRADVTKLT